MSQLIAPRRICGRCIKKLQRIHFQTYTTDVRQKWPSKEVRKSFLDFFCERNDHQFVKSSSVIPPQDAGTYFTNAGMNQFKPIFQGTVIDGSEMSKYTAVANSQKCVRVGGKHNDLEAVGSDLTHHTFFEMLGNWSFGAYGKKEACRLALTLLTEVYKIPMNKLYFTYFDGDRKQGVVKDLETRVIWRELGVPKSHILSFGNKDNFWDMGEVGPCGPCTEIHYNHGNEDLAMYKVNADHPDMVEIWNLVFIQYERRRNGSLTPLPKLYVDTGIGFERMCALMNGTLSNYNTDLFMPIMGAIQQFTGAPIYQGQVGSTPDCMVDRAYRIIADHIRMATVCISDGLLPGRYDQEHKLKSVIYRALYQCHEVFKAKEGLLEHLVDVVVESLGDVYPEISRNSKLVKEVLQRTEQHYLQLSKDGKSNFSKLLKKHPNVQELDADLLKMLQDGRFGHQMSTELIEIMADLHGVAINQESLKDINTEKKALTGDIPQDADTYPCLSGDILDYLTQHEVVKTDDSLKYDYSKSADGTYVFSDADATVVKLLDEINRPVNSVGNGERVGVIVDNTSFYSEKGGQMGDKGIISTETGTAIIDTTMGVNDYVLHIGTVTEGYIETSQEAVLSIDNDFRQACMRNHTATHLFNSALRQVLGTDVRQKSSTVTDCSLTFEFSSVESIEKTQLEKIVNIVNSFIEKDVPLKRELQPLSETKNDEGIISLENVDYPPEVYVVRFDETEPSGECRSAELCAGTHLLNTGDIGKVCVTRLTGQGVYARKCIVCLTGQQAEQAIQRGEEARNLVSDLEQSLKTEADLNHCLKLQKQIGALSQDEMPKVVRDEVEKRTVDAQLNLNILLNKQAYAKLKQDLDFIMGNADRYGVHHLVMKVLPKITKIMKSVKFTKPFILVVDTSNNTKAYVCLPEELQSHREDILNKFKDSVGGKVSVNEETFDIVSGSSIDTKLFMNSAENVLKVFCDSNGNSVKL